MSNGAGVIHLPGILTDRPNQLRNPKLSNPTIQKWYDTTAFAVQTPGTPGNEKPNQLYGPPDRRIDLSLFRNSKIEGRLTLQFRAESFNILNIASFSTPSANLTSGTNGQITMVVANEFPRQHQFALKLLF